MKQVLLFTISLLVGKLVFAQYTVNGNSTQNNCHCYTLTPALLFQSGSVWNNNKINLNQSFNFTFSVNLGCNDGNGADGIVFVLQPISTSVGGTGSGLGYAGITPAVGVTVDTWQNTDPANNDPVYDHIAIQLNGNLNHLDPAYNIAGPVTALNGNDNIEDCLWHTMRIQWDAVTKTITAYMDGSLRVSAVNDFVTNVFSGDPLVYWGFTGSTGGALNLQQFCTALEPHFHLAPNQKRCVNELIAFYDSTISFTQLAKWYWNFGDGSPLDSVNLNPVHTYTIAGDYTVVQTVVGADGCVEVNTQLLRIGSKPVANFGYNDNCVINTIQFSDSSVMAVGTINSWYWDFANGSTSILQNPFTTYTTGGDKLVKLAVHSIEGCGSDTLFKVVHIFTRPVLDFTFTDSVCLGSPTHFFGTAVSSGDPVTLWRWNYGDTTALDTTQNTTHQFLYPGNHTVIFLASSNGGVGCSGLKSENVFVANKPTAYFITGITCASAPTDLRDSSYTTDGIAINQWWWDLGNGQFSTQQDPVVNYTLPGPVTIRHVVWNSRNCISDTTTRVINIRPKADARFGIINKLCGMDPVQFRDSSSASGGTVTQWNWIYNGNVFSTLQNPSMVFLPGIQTVGLITTSIAGCKSDTAFKTFTINAKPAVAMNFRNACKLTPVNFTASEITTTGIAAWNWNFGDGATGSGISTQHIYRSNGNYTVKLTGISSAGCPSTEMSGNIQIYGTNAFAGNDTIAAAGQPVQLNASGGLSYLWSPAGYLNNAFIVNPVAVLNATQTFQLKAFTPEGCESYDEVTISIYKGPDIYLPNAFTPNGDGLNDVLRGIPVGIKEFSYLKIYNRFGEEIFVTTDYRKGWNGMWKGQKQDNGVYVVIAAGTDFRGKRVNKKGTVMLVR